MRKTYELKMEDEMPMYELKGVVRKGEKETFFLKNFK